MTVTVSSLLLLRITASIYICKKENLKILPEIIFYTVCTLLGAFNDWNSVVNKQIYDYHVPHYFDFSSIPVWMLLYWGLILRFIAGLAWKISDGEISNKIGLGNWFIENGLARVTVEIILLLITRQLIYQFFLDPLWSWLPFLIAFFIFILLTFPTIHDLWLILVFLIGGPVIETLYIQVGHLHAYHLAWIGGVPLWIIIWWVLVVLIWKDLSGRLYHALNLL
jgi:hypothetical protein